MVNVTIPTIFWDFEETLAHRPGKWSGTLLRTLDLYESGHTVQIEAIRPFLATGYPWHQSEEPHHHLSHPTTWWAYMEGVFAQAFARLGFAGERAWELARLAHEVYLDPSYFHVYEDTIPTLQTLRDNGWRHIVISNHIPELMEILRSLGLLRYFEDVISSANVGYEKPNPAIYQLALEQAGHPEKVWMVGDNLNADVRGAEGVGIRGIQVRSERGNDVLYYGATLTDVIDIVMSDWT